MNGKTRCPTPTPELEAFGDHHWKIEGNGADCLNCGEHMEREREVRMTPPSTDWKTATAGYTFAEDLNDDGSLPSGEGKG